MRWDANRILRFRLDHHQTILATIKMHRLRTVATTDRSDLAVIKPNQQHSLQEYIKISIIQLKHKEDVHSDEMLLMRR